MTEKKTDKQMRSTSKFLSLVLRHKPEVIGIRLDEHGWADVQELIDGINRTGNHFLDKDLLEEIVRTDEKGRYSFNEDQTLIRANQGHSVPVDVELEEKIPPDILWHGTGEKYVSPSSGRACSRRAGFTCTCHRIWTRPERSEAGTADRSSLK